MKGIPEAHVTETLMASMDVVRLAEFEGFSRLNEHLDIFIAGMNLSCALHAAAVVRFSNRDSSYSVIVKVIKPGHGSFTHEEPWGNFPSDLFKTKLILIAG